MIKILGNIQKEDSYRGGGAVSQSVRLACGRLGFQIPGASYLSRKSRQWHLSCQTLGNRCECYGVLGGRPPLQQAGTLKNFYCFMTLGAEYRSKCADLHR